MPIMLELENRRVLIVGGGKIGYRKACKMLAYGADVTCVSTAFVNEFHEQNQSKLKLIIDTYKECYIHEMQLIIAATEVEQVNNQIYMDANKRGIPCMSVDKSAQSDFTFMATGKKDGFTIGVSTNGKSPGFSKEMVAKLIDAISREDIQRLEILSALRERIMASEMDRLSRSELLKSLQGKSLAELKALLI